MAGKEQSVGQVFTPYKAASFAIEQFNIHTEWLSGKSIFDPTMGKGDLLLAIIRYAIDKGYSIEELPILNLYGNETDTKLYETALLAFKDLYDVDMTKNFSNKDYLKGSISGRYDIIFGNPPWATFADLPDESKMDIKKSFEAYGLVKDKSRLLLGGSRMDISAVIVTKSMIENIKAAGHSYYFLPSSLFRGDEANREFRKYAKDTEWEYSVQEIYDFGDLYPFLGVSTKYCLAHFISGRSTHFPVSYTVHEEGTWKRHKAAPIKSEDDALLVYDDDANLRMIEPIIIRKESVPRQGVNTSGANSIFFFSHYAPVNDSLCTVNEKDILPSKYVYPVVTNSQFEDRNTPPNKWVLLPYRTDGKPLSQDEIKEEPFLSDYLSRYEGVLRRRKGVMIQSWIKRGYWWALLGVGPYSFFEYKVIWESYGKSRFRPIVLDGRWQANQSLQAYIPVRTMEEANRIHKEISNPWTERYLLSTGGAGTMNWAQPGKIKRLLSVR